jgi:hypothetical protein
MSLVEYVDEWELLTPEEKAYVSNGCGPKFAALADWVPDFCGLYTPACDLHDWIYWCGGPMEIRHLADDKLRVDMENINAALPWWKRWSMSWAPRVYYWAVSYLGESSFYEASKRRTRLDLQREMRDAGV